MPGKKKSRNVNALKPGTVLHWYEIREILGQGGFGITYLANDRNLDHEVAIKEYMPIDLAGRRDECWVVPLSHEFEERYHWGLGRFIEEARTLGQFKHPNIVRVRNVFEDNNTAYMVMDYELGESLQDILSRRKILDEEDIQTVIYPIIDGMKQVHAHGYIHRDIKPANIFIRVDGDPVLLDFGSARQSLEESRRSMTSFFSKGYAPIEQYNSSEDSQGAWTDIYALGATMYRAVAGVPPCDAVDRSSAISLASRDTYVTAVEIGAGRYNQSLLQAIDNAMQFNQHERPQTISEWQLMFSPGANTADDDSTDDSDDSSNEIGALLEQAKGGDLNAQANLAYRYGKGINVEQNEKEALHWYKIAADQGHLNSQFNLGVMYSKGRGVEQDYHKALHWYRQAALQGDVTAQAHVANMYLQGHGTDRDEKSAFDWFYRAAKRGHLNALFNVAEMYARGKGVQTNKQESEKWYRKAAQKGHVIAQMNLAYMYGKGEGVERDDMEAIHWYTKAAEAGNPNAQYNLGLIYAKGRGIEKDLDAAKKWYQMAADQGMANAEKSLAKISNR